MSSSRRDFLVLVALWDRALAVAQTHEHTAAGRGASAGRHRFQFLTTVEQASVRKLAAILIPADSRSGGAAAARVEEYLDFVLSHGEAKLQTVWREGLREFAEMEPAAATARLRELSANELKPGTAPELFFVLLKGGVVEAFYTSEEGILKELGYAGLRFLREFPGCTHQSHRAPDSWKPQLRGMETA